MRQAYLDNVATNPLNPEVLEAMMPYLREDFGNPLSNYPMGIKAREALEKARSQVAALIGSRPQNIVFTASGAEANNFALRGIAHAFKDKGRHIIVSKVEHHSILNAARFLEKQGFTVTFLPVNKHGVVEPETLRRAITDETTLVSIIHASSEIGTIEPIKELAAIAHERKVKFHTDGVATVGNIPVDVNDLGVDLMSMAAHQFEGPKGAAALYIREGLRIVPLIYGGIQENGRRAGTENVPAIVGMGKAAEITRMKLADKVERVRVLRDALREAALSVPRVIETGHPTDRLPGHASFCVEYIEGEAMLLMLAYKGIFVASGSACSSRALKSSPILLTMGIPTHVAQGSIVFTLGAQNAMEDVEYVRTEFPAVVNRLREMSPYGKDGWGDADKGEGACIPKK